MKAIPHPRTMLIVQLSIIISLVLSSSLVWATNDFYINNTTSPQVSDMFRYGNVNTALFSGKANVSIPIYKLEDPDFNLHITLRYNSEGFKPRKHSGYIGYNWFLEAGGCITRETKNLPDETQRIYSSHNEKGMLPFTQSPTVDKYAIFNLDSNVVRNCGSKSYNLDTSCEYDIDYLPDLFHFNFCGHQGTFMLNNQGKAVVISGDFVEVDLSNLKDVPTLLSETIPLPNGTSRITIRTTDGYTYVFGGDMSALEFTLATASGQSLKMQYPTTINTWNLKQIIAPNKRTITFYYKQFVNIKNPQESDPLWLFNEYYDYFKKRPEPEIPMPENKIFHFDAMSQSFSKSSILDSIIVSGTHNVHISFHNSTDTHKFYNHGHYSLCKQNYVLDSIQVRTDERVLKTAHLTSIHKSHLYPNSNYGYSWRFLSSVDISGIGEYSLIYHHPTSYPDLYNPGEAYHNKIDYYGYCKSDVFSGLLHTITYPTGGKQVFTFERNDCGIARKYYFLGWDNVELLSDTEANTIVPGVRIRSIETQDINGELIESKTYNYKRRGSDQSSGIYYNNILIYFPSEDPIAGFLVKNNGCYNLLSSHIGYSYVEEVTRHAATNEEYKVGYTFSTGKSYYNSLYDNTINRLPKEMHNDSIPNWYYVLSDMLAYDNMLEVNGKLLLQEFYKNDTIIQSIKFDYNSIPNTTELTPQEPSALKCTDTIVVFSHNHAVITRKLYVCPNLLSRKIVNDIHPNGLHLFNSTNYTYDSKFRIKRESTTNSDGSTYFTKYSYIDDLSFSNTDLSSNPYAFLISLNKIDKPIEVVSGYVQDNLDYITKGQISLYKVEMRMKNTSRANSRAARIIFDPTLPPVPDSLDINNYVRYPSLRNTLNLHVRNGVLDYSPIVGRGDSIVYDNRYKLACEYSFDPLYRLEKITPVDGYQITYTWDGIYPISKTVGNQTSTYTYIPYVGMSSVTDTRGVTTYYEYDVYGRLIEIYQLNNGTKEILNKYIYHIKTE